MTGCQDTHTQPTSPTGSEQGLRRVARDERGDDPNRNETPDVQKSPEMTFSDRVSDLRSIRGNYQRLNSVDYRARYIPMYIVTDHQLRRLVEVHLRRIGNATASLLKPGR